MLRVAAVVSTVFVSAAQARNGWRDAGPPDAVESVSASLALRLRNAAWLESEFAAVTDPAGPRYRHFATVKHIQEMTDPREEDVEALVRELLSRGVKVNGGTGDVLHISAPSAVLDALLNTRLRRYRKGQVEMTRSLVHPTPPHPLVHAVWGLSGFPTRTPVVLKHAAASPEAIAPQTVRAQYRIPASPPAHNGNISLAQLSFCTVGKDDPATWCKKSEANCSWDPTRDILHGGSTNIDPCGEANMDVEMAFTTAPGIKTLVDGGYSDFGPWLNSWNRDENAYLVGSLSYGGDESSDDSRTDQELQKTGLLGRSVFVASGDAGANGGSTDVCPHKLKPEYPASSPYATSVGATEMTPGTAHPLPSPSPLCTALPRSGTCVGNGTERAVSLSTSDFTSGGGFSNLFAVQPWQKQMVQAYLSSGVSLPPRDLWNSSGRAYPDVSAFGGQNVIVSSGKTQLSGGTSAATPLWAGVFALLNAVALQKSNKPLGFPNPILYKMAAERPECFTDITVGDNKCPSSIVRDCAACHGFSTTKGWDPVSGLGTPNFPCMADYIKQNF